MKKLLIASAMAATSFFAPQAFAQAKNFEGFSVLGAANINNNKVEGTTVVDRTETNIGLQAEYGLALGESFVLGLGASLGLSDITVASDAKLKNTASFYVTPGITVSNTVLLYGKIAAVSAKLDTAVGAADMSGIGYGLGARFFTSKNVYVQTEYMFNKYDDKKVTPAITAKNQTGVLSLGIGYKF